MHELLAAASRLSNEALLERVRSLVAHERVASVALIAHLAELDTRRIVLAHGVGSLYVYCTEVLHLSGHAAYGRIAAARTARKFPVVLDLLANGSVNLTTIAILSPHLTEENHRAVLAEARWKSRDEVKSLKARWWPEADVPSSVRKLPVPPKPARMPGAPEPVSSLSSSGPTPARAVTLAAPTRPAVVEPLAPERYRLQITMAKETHDTLRRLQDLLAREIPGGDPAAIVDRALRPTSVVS